MSPLKAGKSKAVISANIEEMIKAGHSQQQSVAAALRNAGVPPKGAKSSKGGGKGGKKK